MENLVHDFAFQSLYGLIAYRFSFPLNEFVYEPLGSFLWKGTIIIFHAAATVHLFFTLCFDFSVVSLIATLVSSAGK